MARKLIPLFVCFALVGCMTYRDGSTLLEWDARRTGTFDITVQSGQDVARMRREAPVPVWVEPSGKFSYENQSGENKTTKVDVEWNTSAKHSTSLFSSIASAVGALLSGLGI